MLVTINLATKDPSVLEAKGLEIANTFVGKTNVYLPRSVEDFVDKVRKHKNNAKGTNHLVLLGSHFNLESSMTEGTWRTAELFFQRYGGSVWGEEPTRESLTYQGTLEDLDRVALQASYDEGRLSVYKKLPSAYFGRTSSDPHTLVVGFKPPYPKTTRYSEFVMEGLPAEQWQGTAFIPASQASKKGLGGLIEWLDQTNVVSIGDDAHAILEELGVEHGSLPRINDVYRREDPKAPKKFGMALREATRTFGDMRDWKP